MIQTIKNIKVEEIPVIIRNLGISADRVVNLTIELVEEKNDLLTIIDAIGKKAQAQGLTEETLAELLADES
jgi:ParB-like chromosome segregation protein Spo0J